MTQKQHSIQESLLMDRSRPGRSGYRTPASDVPAQPLPDSSILRDELPLPELSEGEIVRYFTNLSQLNFSIDTNFYPLGSCTMKYNPKINDLAASIQGFSQLHPLQPENSIQGALAVMFQLQSFLTEMTGMKSTCLTPLGGAQGELAGILMFKAYHAAAKQTQRKKILIPDSAHGTNPASAAMGGFEVVSIPSDKNGNMDLSVLHQHADNELAGLMYTLPTTLGLFDTNIVEICKVVHDAGGLVYGDGANMNALVGQTRIGSLGFDVVHINLHKTFSTPHGGGGPGAGPISVNDTLEKYLPTPIVIAKSSKELTHYSLLTPDNSIGKLSAFHGNFGVLLRAFTYIMSLGGDGIRANSENAVINANYILQELRGIYDLPYDRTCMHEVVLSAKKQKANGVKALDIAKRLLDYGFHAPTMYFPLIVEEALMVEPTETESKEAIDGFISAMKAIALEAAKEPSLVQQAPHTTPISRLDEAKAARQPDLRWSSQPKKE